MNAVAEPDVEWRAFMTEPAAYINPERLAGCFGGALPASLCGRMLAVPRLTDRLSQVIASHYRLPPPTDESAEAVDRTIALTPATTLPELAGRAGAIWWAAAIANTVMARDVSALHAAIGEPLCSFAVRNRDLAGPELPLTPLDTLAERMIADGWRCLAAWCDAVDPATGARTRLKLPMLDALGGPVPEPLAKASPAIIRRAAAG